MEKNEIKAKIKNLMELGYIKECEEIIKSYIDSIKDDYEIYSIYSVLLYNEKRYDEALQIILEALSIDINNFELNYNLAIVYEALEDYGNALAIYEYLMEYHKLDSEKENIINYFNVINNNNNNNNFKKVKRLVILVSENGDSFLGDIINELKNEFIVIKKVINDLKEIDESMQWADICWFEWCDQLIAYGSNINLAKEKKIVCRLHRYEVFTNYPEKVNWWNVDKLIIVTDHLKEFLISKVKNIEEMVDIITINNGVNLDKYDLREGENGFNIAYVGYIHQRKNPVLLLQIMNKIIKKDKRYKLYIAGEFQDELIKLYWDYQVKQMGLQNNIFFDGWQDNINKWLEDKNYILSSSIHESFGYGIAEAMAQGIKPIIHNFIFSKEIWNEKYLFNTVDEAVEMIINEEYDSEEYRSFIEKKYSLSRQMLEINRIIDDIDSVNKKKNINSIKLDFNYKGYWEERYKNGGNSGYGSYGKLAEFKAEIVNTLICENNIKNVIEFGCGDGNQLKYMKYENYVGLDISQNVIEKCSMAFRYDINKKFSCYTPGELLTSRFENIDMSICLDVLYHIIDEEDFIKTLDDIFSVSAEVVVLYTILEQPKIELAVHLKHRNIIEYLNKYKNYSIDKIIKQKYSDDSLADFIILKKKKDIITIKYIEEGINSINNFSYSMKNLIDDFKFDNCDIAIGKLEKLSENYLLIECIITNKINKQIILTGITLDMLNNKIIYPEYIEKSKKINEVDIIIRKIIQSEISKINESYIHGFIYDKGILRDVESNALAYNWERGIPGTQFMPLSGYLNVILRYELAGKYIDENDFVLEAACGFGYGAAYLSSICKQVEAIDIAKDNIEFAKRTYSFENINWIEDDVTNLPYEDNTFDTYVNYETLEHIPLNLVEIYIGEAARVLKKDGKFIISTPNELNRKNVNNPFHIKEYNFIEFDSLLKKYFNNIYYYSIEDNILTNGISSGSKVMIAIAYNL